MNTFGADFIIVFVALVLACSIGAFVKLVHDVVKAIMIPQSRHSITREDIKFVGKALAGDFLTRGPLTLEFEAKIAELCGKKYCVTIANGTVALHAALLACNAKHVVSPTLTFSAIANATHFAGAKLYLTDVDSYKLHATTYSQPLPAKGLVFVPMDYAGLP